MERSPEALARAAQEARRRLATLSTQVKNEALLALADALLARKEAILAANEADLVAARGEGMSEALLDRLRLDEGRLEGMARSVRDIVALPDPVGERVEARRTPEGLVLERRRVPLGVILVVYEARPNVTVDAAALCLKAGNAVILRGGRDALRTNRALAETLGAALGGAGLPEAAAQLVTDPDRARLLELVRMPERIDLVIPRGGEALKRFLLEHSRIPVVHAAGGNCHVYVDRAANLEQALAIILNAKCQRPGVCNAAETLLVHRDAAKAFLPRALAALAGAGVRLHGDEATRALSGEAAVEPATDADYATEYLALELAVRVVADLDEALDHIERFGTRHSEAIVTADPGAARRFTEEVDAAAVYVNASTRFTDGGVFGMGAEIGISTQKLHVRGPIGLRDLTSVRWVVVGEGHVR